MTDHHSPLREVASHAALDADLAALRASLSAQSTPPAVQARLAAAFAARHRSGWRVSIVQWWAPGGALIASAAMSAWMLLAPAPAAMVPFADPAASAPFIAISPLEQIALEPNPRVIETRVPKMMLASLGVPVSPENAADTLKAEMLVSAAGQPLALRLTAE